MQIINAFKSPFCYNEIKNTALVFIVIIFAAYWRNLMNNILVFDVGTSSMRGILYNEEGKAVFKSQIRYNPKYMEDNCCEQATSDWENGLINISKEINEKAKSKSLEISAIALTSQRSSIIPVDKKGNPLHDAIMWQDKRTCKICDELKSYEKQIYALTGSKVNPIFSAPKMTWLKRNSTEIYNKAYKLITVHDFLIFLLTGNYVTDHSIASRSLLFNITTLQWDKWLLKVFDVDEEKLCSLVEPGAICGYITEEISERCGLKKGTPVISAGGDQQNAALGLNIINQGSLEVNTGTGSYIIACSDKPRFDEKMRMICNASAIPGKYILEAGMPTTGTVYRWFNENFYSEESRSGNSYEKINSEAASAPIGSNGLVLLPHLQGRGAPYFNPLAKGVFCNMTLGTKRSDFARAILEGIACEVYENIQVIQEMVGDIELVSAAGGLTSFDLFNQIQADMYNKKVLCYENEEASSLGAWISAAKTTGMFASYEEAFAAAIHGTKTRIHESIPDNSVKYEQHKQRSKALYDALDKAGLYLA